MAKIGLAVPATWTKGFGIFRDVQVFIDPLVVDFSKDLLNASTFFNSYVSFRCFGGCIENLLVTTLKSTVTPRHARTSTEHVYMITGGGANNAPFFDHRAHHSAPLNLLALRHPTEPVEENSARDIESDIHPQNTKVPPARIPMRIDALQKLVRIVHLAVLALAGSLRVAQKATSFRDVVTHVLGAGLVRRREEPLVLGFVAVCGCFTKCCGHEAGDEVRERIYLVESVKARR
jgi:hypothetical protein